MSDNLKAIRGYALPFNSIGTVDGSYEKFAPGAFSAMFPLPAIDVRWFDHDPNAVRLASTAGGTASFFVDDFGLGFEAFLDMGDAANWGRLKQITQRRDPMAFASIGGLVIVAHRWEKYGDANCRIVTSASFSHIAIVDASAAYHATAVWPADAVDAAPWKIRELAAKWRVGRTRWQEREAATARARSRQTGYRAVGQTASGCMVMMSASGRLSVHTAIRAKSEMSK